MTMRAGKPYFRDMLQTVDERGRRRWLYPKRPAGKLYAMRWAVASLILLAFFSGPFIRVHGEPLFLLNFFERRFILFGQVFWPQDFHIIVLSIIALIIFIILFTVIYGRIFCGWACPQTLFMEFVFRQIEYLIEGGSHRQQALDARAWDLEKIARKLLKHMVFVGCALAVAYVSFAYIYGARDLREYMAEGILAMPGLFLAMALFTAVFYLVFAFFREQVCILVCPYGRLQGALLDENTIVVAYDYTRGEPRALFKPYENREEAKHGHCVDCHNCVAVCPTGIDIRNGTQLECVNCTACIDACNKVMKRMQLPPGLIRYDSESNLVSGRKKLWTPRVMAYTAALCVLLISVAWMYASRDEVEVTILRVPGTLYQEYGPDKYANLFTIQLVNKSREDVDPELKLISHEADILFVGESLNAAQGQVSEATFMVVMDKKQLKSGNIPIQFGLFSGDRLLTKYMTNFIGPRQK